MTFFFLQRSKLSASKNYKFRYLKIRKFSSDKQEVRGRREGIMRHNSLYMGIIDQD